MKFAFFSFIAIYCNLGLAVDLRATPMHVEMISQPNGLVTTWTLRGVNGRKLLCPDTGKYAAECTVDQMEAPLDCDWECRDGVLSGQGRSVFLGSFVLQNSDPVKVPQRLFKIEAAWDTWRNQSIRGPLYRIVKQDATYSLQQVDRQKKPRVFSRLDLSRSDDVNFQLEPEKAAELMESPLGLMVTGQLQGSRFIVDQIWRQWSPRLTCDVWSVAKERAFPLGGDELTQIFGTLEEAIAYQDPEGRSVRWLIWEHDTTTGVVFRSGINDLFAEVFSVAWQDCSVIVLEEH